MPLEPGDRLGPFEVTAFIGAGGMGEVYRARDTNLNRDVAVKVLPDTVAADAEGLARFRREAELLAALNHPNVAQIYGVETSDAGPALIMELVEGATLQEAIREKSEARSQKSEVVEWALPIARQIAEALEAAHERGIVHRDLKPANIKVTDNGTVKVLDFGLGKALAPEPGSDAARELADSPTVTAHDTRHGVVLGTVAYMSPEQARGLPLDRRTDIWSFGCVLYELLTGRGAFQGRDPAEVLAAVIKADPDWAALPTSTPMRAVRLHIACLQRAAG